VICVLLLTLAMDISVVGHAGLAWNVYRRRPQLYCCKEYPGIVWPLLELSRQSCILTKMQAQTIEGYARPEEKATAAVRTAESCDARYIDLE
jgi:hypothetical protein